MDWGPNTESDSKAFVKRVITYQSSKPRTNYELAITIKATGELVGGCGINLTRPVRKEGVIGYCLNKAHWGKGYGTEAARALLGFGFARLALHRIFALCDPQNIGSNRVLEKAGMTLEGRLREDSPVRGKWHDTMIYAILKREWTSRKRVHSDKSEISGDNIQHRLRGFRNESSTACTRKGRTT
jgi:RimJ/RimL family protein N-acetyltransferase